MPTVVLTARLEDSGSGTEPIVNAGWMYRVRPSMDYVNGSGEAVIAAWPAGGGWKAFNGASATLDLDILPADNPYYLELRGPADPSSSPRLPVYRKEYRQVVTGVANGTSWWALTRVSGPGPDATEYPASGYAELQAAITDLQNQIDNLTVGGGGASTLAGITDMSANARTFNAAANYLAMRNALLAAGTTTVDDLAVGDDATVTGDLTVSGAVTVPDGSIAQAKVVNLVSNLAAKAPLASPALTGVPTAPTAAVGTSTTQIATTAFVDAAVVDGPGAPDADATTKGLVQLAGDLSGTAAAPTVVGLTAKAPLASPALTGTPTAPTASAGTSTTQIATTAFVRGNVETVANVAPGTVVKVAWAGSGTPNRGTTRTDVVVAWVGPNPDPPVVSSGTAGMYDGDLRFRTAF